MNIHRFIFFCFSSAALFRGSTDLVNTQSSPYTKLEGEDFRVSFDFQVPAGGRMYLCRSDCKENDILTENRAQGEKYTIRYDTNDSKVYVVIKEVSQSDAGRYKVGVSTSSSQDPEYKEFELRVRELCERDLTLGEPRVYSGTEGGKVTIRCSMSSHPRNRRFLCRDECKKFLFHTSDETATEKRYKIVYGDSDLFNVTITELTVNDFGQYRCGVLKRDGENTCQRFEITVSDGKVLTLVICVTLLAVLLVVLLLLLHKKKLFHVTYANAQENDRNAEVDIYDNCGPVPNPEESPYQELDSYTQDQNMYCSLQG
ncbi:uncharacterized protein LOC121192955 [Toxotes jaculatrix]|uniref:uncharacterized protein LOC121192955 n=1 Tax=Toxotes jaculatrix TaxID=941984 RepID=UPI001B3AEE97|nr:uncharacterized protein LOC121192955 [Toxotes jaculatrix]